MMEFCQVNEIDEEQSTSCVQFKARKNEGKKERKKER